MVYTGNRNSDNLGETSPRALPNQIIANSHILTDPIRHRLVCRIIVGFHCQNSKLHQKKNLSISSTNQQWVLDYKLLERSRTFKKIIEYSNTF